MILAKLQDSKINMQKFIVFLYTNKLIRKGQPHLLEQKKKSAFK